MLSSRGADQTCFADLESDFLTKVGLVFGLVLALSAGASNLTGISEETFKGF
jgi:hypothetical protein